MTRFPGAVPPLAAIALSLAWPWLSEHLIQLGLPQVFGPEPSGRDRLMIHHYALTGTLLLTWLAAGPAGRTTANVLVGLAALAALAAAAFQAWSELTMTLLWCLTALTATAVARASGRTPLPPRNRRNKPGFTDPAELDRLFGPPPVRAFKNAVLFLLIIGLTFTVYHLFGRFAPPSFWGDAATEPLPPYSLVSAKARLILDHAWAFALGPWLLPLLLLGLSGPRRGLTGVPALGAVMLLGAGAWAKYNLWDASWSGGEWLTAWSAVAGALVPLLAWAAILAALADLIRRRTASGREKTELSGVNPAERTELHCSRGGDVQTARPGSSFIAPAPCQFRPWVRLGMLSSLGLAALVIFLAVCFHQGRPGAALAPQPWPGGAVNCQAGHLEIKLPADFQVVSSTFHLPWKDQTLIMLDLPPAVAPDPESKDREEREAPAGPAGEDYGEVLGRPARLVVEDFTAYDPNVRRERRPNRSRISLFLTYQDQGQVSLYSTVKISEDLTAEELAALKRARKDDFIEAAAEFLRVYQWLGPEEAAGAPVMAGYRTRSGHISRWDEGEPGFRFRLAPAGSGAGLSLDYNLEVKEHLGLNPAEQYEHHHSPGGAWPLRGKDPPGVQSPARPAGSEAFQVIVARCLGFKYGSYPAGPEKWPGRVTAELADGPRDPLYSGVLGAVFRWRPNQTGVPPLSLELTVPPRSKINPARFAWVWGELLSDFHINKPRAGAASAPEREDN